MLAALPGGRSVAGTVGGVYGDTLVTVEYSRLGPKHRLRAWVQLLALTAGQPGPRVAARAPSGAAHRGGPSRSTLGPVDPDDAPPRVLAALVDLYDAGLREPLPLSPRPRTRTPSAARAAATPHDAVAKAGDEWTRFGGGGESDDPAHTLVWGAAAPLDACCRRHRAAPPSSRRRFGALAMRLWAPLLAAETVDRP